MHGGVAGRAPRSSPKWLEVFSCVLLNGAGCWRDAPLLAGLGVAAAQINPSSS